MSALAQLLEEAQVPRRVKGRITRAQLAAAVDRITEAAGEIRAGTARLEALTALTGVLLGELGDGFTAYQAAKAAKAAVKAAQLAAEAAREEEAHLVDP